jgi:methylmalonyl-CoA decarboxylase subunit alpha
MAYDRKIEELAQQHKKAEVMGGAKKVAARHAKGLLDARQRVDYLLDDGSFKEVGKFATSLSPDDRDTTPADGKISGFGRIDGRKAAVVANDLTVKGASSNDINAKKMSFIKRTATRNGMPIVFLGESSGARIPDVMGAVSMGLGGQDSEQYVRRREIPWATAVLGPCFGSSAWYTSLSDFVVMRKGSELAVSSARVTSIAINQEVDPEELGGWRLHTGITGLVDLAVDTDEEALNAVQKFLSYLPSHSGEAPPRAPVPAGSGDDAANILDLVPEERQKIYDVRKVIENIVDKGSFFPLKERFGKVAVTGLARLDGHSVGFIASNPRFKGGAMDTDSCDKVTSFLVMCDSFNIPVVLLVDTPGFLVGIEGERNKAPGKIMNFMHALQLCSMPKISVVMRKTYGQAYLNMGGGQNSDEVAAWYTAEISFMAPDVGVSVVYGVHPESDPQRYEEMVESMRRGTTAYDLARCFGAQDVIDPRETRSYLIETLEYHRRDRTNGIGEHEMRTWPATF